MNSKFDFQEDYVINEINNRKSKLVLVQLPEGLKQEAIRLVKYFESKTKSEIIISGETCWGGCDLALDEAKNLSADLLVHYGHAPFMKKVDFPVIYIEMKDKTPIYSLLEKSKKDVVKFKSIGLVCSVQHIYQLEQAKNFFENLGKKVIIPNKKGYAYYD